MGKKVAMQCMERFGSSGTRGACPRKVEKHQSMNFWLQYADSFILASTSWGSYSLLATHFSLALQHPGLAQSLYSISATSYFCMNLETTFWGLVSASPPSALSSSCFLASTFPSLLTTVGDTNKRATILFTFVTFATLEIYLVLHSSRPRRFCVFCRP